MKISILLPYKENFSPTYAGAVSLFVKDTVKLSEYKKYITVYGNTNLKNIFKLSYKNIIYFSLFFYETPENLWFTRRPSRTGSLNCCKYSV